MFRRQSHAASLGVGGNVVEASNVLFSEGHAGYVDADTPLGDGLLAGLIWPN